MAVVFECGIEFSGSIKCREFLTRRVQVKFLRIVLSKHVSRK